jgi:hypothetical protein
MGALHVILPTMNFEAFRNSITSPALQAVAAHWDAARGDQMMPAWQQLRPARIAAQLPIIWAYRFNRQTCEFVGRLAGDRIARHYGKNFRGIRLEALHAPEVLPAIVANMRRVVEGPALYRCSGKLFRQRDRTGTGERIMLPLAGDGVHGDGLIGASDYEYAMANPDYGPVELIAEGPCWFALAPDPIAA